ncbi:uncharacterized protein LOC131843542 [Achroia grisella]|uniref:uncharacterized protein LOC131843542 n=1 Tax=Achroia grisella TaxID=688607 RepID=UPI0027D2F512|nr:uncharacterized protein LOC131843542 [Achroia grisella]
MDSEYDRKFEEMKKYVPFLESMIKKLESTSSGSLNPRQAQLDKIKSLRDLLLDRKKRMKMDNLLKCEQVLINLYAKVEQRDSMSNKETAEFKPKENAELEIVRNKLKTVAKRKEDDSLPEIAGANEIPETSMAGSKEPALFQRRPNKNSLSQETSSKRNYTRILVSPEPNTPRWANLETAERALFSRRSPRKSPQCHSPTYKRERKKSSKSSRKQQDLNITLKVPEESLNSLNTTDILSRIINCSDGDVDIDTLRVLRTQILGELKHTGATEDISDLILKTSSKKKKPKEKAEVEEGELSDSESEAIENIYGSLVILDKDQKTPGQVKTNNEDKNPRKIQIRLVINSDKDTKTDRDKDPSGETMNKNEFDNFDFETYQGDKLVEFDTNDCVKEDTSIPSKNKCDPIHITTKNTESTDIDEKNIDETSAKNMNKNTETDLVFVSKDELNVEKTQDTIFKPNFYKPLVQLDPIATNKSVEDKSGKSVLSQTEKKDDMLEAVAEKVDDNTEILNTKEKDVEIPLLNEQSVVSQQPKESVVSEIDILQALKNEILSENIAIPGTDASTPPLHQPKVTKVASAQEILPKKRISIENYKKKTSSAASTLFPSKEITSSSINDEHNKKQSLKLTEKEFERFKSILNDIVSSDDDNANGSIASVDDIYSDLAPKSPDDDNSASIGNNAPIIIPIDPIKTAEINSKADIDMRKSNTIPSPHCSTGIPLGNTTPSVTDTLQSRDDGNLDKSNSEKMRTIADPRVKKVSDSSVKENGNQYSLTPDRTQKPLQSVNFPIMTPTVAPSIIPNVTTNMNPSMTPSRTPNMTPRPYDMMHQSFEIEDQPKRKHVYASLYDPRDYRDQSVNRDAIDSHWEKQENSTEIRKNKWDTPETKDSRKWDECSRSSSLQRDSQDFQKYKRYNDPYHYNKYKNSRRDRYSFDKRNERYGKMDPSTSSHHYSRSECPSTPSHSFGRSDCPPTPSHPFGRSDCPPTPSHPFGRSDCPPTPSHPFGRSECPSTPSHPFGRSDYPPSGNNSFGRSEYPLTPNHPFGRSECPPTPSHAFGRSECPPTPINTFGRCELSSDLPVTPNHPFGRLDRDPRLKRNSEFESNIAADDKDRGHFRSRNMQFGFYSKSYKNTDNYRNYKGDGRNERHRYYSYEQNECHYYKDSTLQEQYCKDRRSTGNDYHEKEKIRNRERSVGRSIPSEGTIVRTSREHSVGRSFEVTDTDNTLSVKSHAGRSFTIDTRVDRTFQGINDNEDSTERTFDVRRQRAASVGRSFSSVRDTNIGRTLSHSFKSNDSHVDGNIKRNFRRALSVVRSTDESNMNKSFKEIKADLKSYKLENNKYERHSLTLDNIHSKGDNKIITGDKESKNANSYPKVSYSPRKNNRDPRLQRELLSDKSKYKYSKTKTDYDRKKHGIVYSHDNIASGSILGSGYGVKNYKIPKIKRVTEIEPTKELPDDSKKIEKQTDNKLDDNLKKDVKQNKRNDVVSKKMPKDLKEPKLKETEKKSAANSQVNTATPMECTEKRITRSNKKAESEISSGQESITKTKRRIRVYNSDSDDNSKLSDTKCKHSNNENESNKQQSVVDRQSPNEQDLDSSFGVDDLEMFSDNIVDPVLENINALIADLDHDINTPKDNANNNLNNEISIDNMFENITSEVIDSSNKQSADDISLSDITEIIKNDSREDQNLQHNAANLTKSLGNDIISQKSLLGPNEGETSTKPLENSSLQDNCENHPVTLFPPKEGNENLVSTTDIDSNTKDQNLSLTTNEKSEVSIVDEDNSRNSRHCSVPDSTNNVVVTNNSIVDEDLPDSTNDNDLKSEINSDITSSHDTIEIIKSPIEQSSSNKNVTHAVDSIDSILSILQNKSKIKELLSKLVDQTSDNEKIKKKLEKLSEIVSDDEDTKDDTDQNITDKILNTESSDQNDANSEIENVNLSKESIGTNAKDDLSKESICANENDDSRKETINANDNKISDDNKLTKDDNDTKQVAPEVSLNNELHNTTTDSEVVNNNLNKKVPIKKGKVVKRTKIGKNRKKTLAEGKRVTRSESANIQKPKNKVSRELLQLQEDIKEMFISEDILNATGIRMCRLAKLVDEKIVSHKENVSTADNEPVVVLEKFKNTQSNQDVPLLESKTGKTIKRNPGPKFKVRAQNDSSVSVQTNIDKLKLKYKPGPKSKTKVVKNHDVDPYEFETDSVAESSVSKFSESSLKDSSDSENESLASSKSYESTEVSTELKKKTKRKRPGWNAGIIKPKNKKRKSDSLKNVDISQKSESTERTEQIGIPDMNCFTDKTYCFQKHVNSYSCRLCVYSGDDIVAHYKIQHPHSEIPLSRLNPETAKEAIEQCEDINFQAISKIPMNKFVCRFCFNKEFGKKKNSLESFFWHVVSTHTGEYKQLCSNCINITKCPFNLDIPPPPKDTKGQLIGYICGKCNFTQISLENLKTHVIVRHNDEQTEVYTINLAVMSKKMMNIFSKRSSASEIEQPRLLRSTRCNQNMAETSDDRSDITDTSDAIESMDSTQQSTKDTTKNIEEMLRESNFKSKITFENDDSTSEISNMNTDDTSKYIVKQEDDDEEVQQEERLSDEVINTESELDSENVETPQKPINNTISDDIFAYPHFRITYTETGNKEFVCCINGNKHYTTTLLISMKKHVQLKHNENWDGFCCVCKVIVTPQGQHKFKDCLQHFLDKHMDDFPVLEKVALELEEPAESTPAPKQYINVRPLSELKEKITSEEIPVAAAVLPKIESVISLSSAESSPSYSVSSAKENMPAPLLQSQDEQYNYEEAQAEVMSKKYHIVLEAMMAQEKLVNVYKCPGRYCSFTTDSADVALMHAKTHQQIGGENALRCAYCDFDCGGHPIDLVVHVFKHSACCFVCGYCFYRSVASQLVIAHINRVHTGKPSRVLCATNASPPSTENAPAMLPREIVVPFYVCNHVDKNGRCKFRSYTSRKFSDHILQLHGDVTTFKCDICSEPHASAAELIHHMKEHNFNLYQCTWCLHGADGEPELLSHAATHHPARMPQAYLRIITSKEGTSQYRVLPLASFHKSKVKIIEVTPNTTHENPVREAERSIELEKLIGFTNQLTLSVGTTESEQDKEMQDSNPTFSDNTPQNIAEQEPILTEIKGVDPPSIHTSPLRTSTPQPQPDISRQETPVLKTEPVDPITPSKDQSDDIVCLDSDDESSRLTIIDLSDDDAIRPSLPKTPEDDYKKIPETILFKCPKCKLVFKSAAGLKIHLSSCYAGKVSNVQCAHCTKTLENKETLTIHYIADHAVKSRYLCGVCGLVNMSLAIVKRHVKSAHKVTKLAVMGKYSTDGTFEHIVIESNKSTKNTRAPKRKLSLNSSSEPQPKLKRYGPQDIHLLPINPILDDLVHCSVCSFSTKVRLNMVRHLQFHAEQQPVPQMAPVNPVPHLETNEKHFDKMLNLASSSIITRLPEKTARSESTPVVSTLIPPEVASRYPKYVPERQRHTCGAKGCSYISLDEAMLRCHWETLHSGSNDFHCVHCPPYQHLDTSKPLTASRIIAHLKMHDTTLYACVSCPYYHYKRAAVEKHLSDVHKGGQVLVVREETTSIVNTQPVQPAAAAPTMDLKPWQCGLCKFKSMLRPEVVEHCSKIHQSKMQFKCAYCPFRTSALENVTKHQANAHAGKVEDIFYYYYREGSIPNDASGNPRWLIQRQRSGVTAEAEVKTEYPDPSLPKESLSALESLQPRLSVDLNIVKQEVDTTPATELTMEDLCKKYGNFCDTNGLKYKCPLCKVVTEDDKESIQSHLYEELQYRKWGCVVCSYKAFHKTGLQEHMSSEHRGQYQSPIELPVDINIENWVAGLIEHQTKVIVKNKEKLAKQRIQAPPAVPSTSTVYKTTVAPSNTSKANIKELEQAFGSFGGPSNSLFSCPKCTFKTNDEVAMHAHLESELTKIRWCCSKCSDNFQTYHEVQFHCKSVHDGQFARPIEAIRDPVMRASWVTTVLQVQKLNIKSQHMETVESSPEKADMDNSENSLLVVRYEENVSMPEVGRRKRPAPAPSRDSDLERQFVIDVSSDNSTVPKKLEAKCPYCDYTTSSRHGHEIKTHILRHYNLKPYKCPFCSYNSQRAFVLKHIEQRHPNLPVFATTVDIPNEPPLVLKLSKSGSSDDKRQTMPYAQSPNVPINNVSPMELKTPIKRVAKKSTTKLPPQRIAKKSTTKLPFYADSELKEYSYYGTKPDSLDKFANVTTLMSFCNRMMPFNIKKLSEIIEIEPKVLVRDIKDGTQ